MNAEQSIGKAGDVRRLETFKNPYRKWASSGMIIACGSLPLLVTGFLVKGNSTPAMLSFGVIIAIIGLSVFIKCRGLADKVDAVLEGDFIAHWTYEPDEWRRYLEIEFPRQSKDIADTMPETYIWRGGILINNRCYWFDYRPHEVIHIADEPSLIQFKWKTLRQGGSIESQLRVPIPAGQEGKARQVIEQFGLTWEGEVRRQRSSRRG